MEGEEAGIVTRTGGSRAATHLSLLVLECLHNTLFGLKERLTESESNCSNFIDFFFLNR